MYDFVYLCSYTNNRPCQKERKKETGDAETQRKTDTEKHRERQKVETKFYFTIDRQITGYD